MTDATATPDLLCPWQHKERTVSDIRKSLASGIKPSMFVTRIEREVAMLAKLPTLSLGRRRVVGLTVAIVVVTCIATLWVYTLSPTERTTAGLGLFTPWNICVGLIGVVISFDAMLRTDWLSRHCIRLSSLALLLPSLGRLLISP